MVSWPLGSDAGFSSRLVTAKVTPTAASPRTAPRLARFLAAASPALITIHSSERSAARLSTTNTVSDRRRASVAPLPGAVLGGRTPEYCTHALILGARASWSLETLVPAVVNTSPTPLARRESK
jgi:hypothetical protein